MMYAWAVKIESAAWGKMYAESLPIFPTADDAERGARDYCRQNKLPEPRYTGRAEDGRAHIVITKDGEPC